MLDLKNVGNYFEITNLIQSCNYETNKMILKISSLDYYSWV